MKASALHETGWECDSLEVLWEDAKRVFSRLRRDAVESERHAFIPVPSDGEQSDA
jgi:hypothetical protein